MICFVQRRYQLIHHWTVFDRCPTFNCHFPLSRCSVDLSACWCLPFQELRYQPFLGSSGSCLQHFHQWPLFSPWPPSPSKTRPDSAPHCTGFQPSLCPRSGLDSACSVLHVPLGPGVSPTPSSTPVQLAAFYPANPSWCASTLRGHGFLGLNWKSSSAWM